MARDSPELQRFAFLHRHEGMSRKALLLAFRAWTDKTLARRLVSHFEEGGTVRPGVCLMEKEYHQFFRKVLHIPARALRSNICSEITLRLTSRERRFAITCMKTSGSYGIILSAVTEDGQKVIIKMYNLGRSDGVDPQNLPWFNIPASRFQVYCRTLSLLSEAEPDIVPEFLGCNIVSLGRGANSAVFGLLFMADRGEMDMFHALHHAAKGSRSALSRAAGKTLRSLHESGISHGDAHPGNFVVDEAVSVAVDLDMAIIFTRPTGLDFCKRFDVCSMLLYLKTSAARKDFAEGYLGGKKGVKSFMEEHAVLEEDIAAQRRVYESLHAQIMVTGT